MARETLDATDRDILRYLHDNGRASHEEVAEAVGISEENVTDRVEALESADVITRYTALVDPMKLGYISVAFGIRTDPNNTDAIAAELADHPNVYKIWILSGKHNVIVHANFKDIEDFQAFSHDTLHHIEGIVEYESSIATQQVISEGPRVLEENGY